MNLARLIAFVPGKFVVSRAFLLASLLSLFLSLAATAEDSFPAAYVRNREASLVSAGFGDGLSHTGWHHRHGYPLPYAFPWSSPLYITGTWYQRPYPYHFDYYRLRYSMSLGEIGASGCPIECSLDE